jgi:hypothetical protein
LLRSQTEDFSNAFPKHYKKAAQKINVERVKNADGYEEPMVCGDASHSNDCAKTQQKPRGRDEPNSRHEHPTQKEGNLATWRRGARREERIHEHQQRKQTQNHFGN